MTLKVSALYAWLLLYSPTWALICGIMPNLTPRSFPNYSSVPLKTSSFRANPFDFSFVHAYQISVSATSCGFSQHDVLSICSSWWNHDISGVVTIGADSNYSGSSMDQRSCELVRCVLGVSCILVERSFWTSRAPFCALFKSNEYLTKRGFFDERSE